jgi:hypothetical protein
MEGIVRLGPDGKYHLHVGGQDTKLKSKDPTYFEYHLGRKDVAKLNALGLTKVRLEDSGVVAAAPPANTVAPPIIGKSFTIDQKFKMMEQLIKMTIRGSSKGMLITGKGGIGKTYTVLDMLERMGKTDWMKARADAGVTEITTDDADDEIEAKVESLAELGVSGDYVIFKGYASAAALYRLLYEHKNRIVIFDDCDKIIKDGTALNVLKGALDTYEERWVSWNTNAAAPDLPPCFKFEGQVIIISNSDMDQIDDAVKTRCFKVDVSMTPEQRVQRMRSVLPKVMPEIDLALKQEALQLMVDNLDVAIDVSFRSLMNVIKLRVEPDIDWEDVAVYSLTQKW